MLSLKAIQDVHNSVAQEGQCRVRHKCVTSWEKSLMEVAEQCSLVWQMAAIAHEGREINDSWVNACAGFIPQTWNENLGLDIV